MASVGRQIALGKARVCYAACHDGFGLVQRHRTSAERG